LLDRQVTGPGALQDGTKDAESHGSLLSHAGSRDGNLRRGAIVLGSHVVAREDSVTNPLDALLAELEEFGKANDGTTTDRPRRMLNITRDTGEFLAVLVRATVARRVLEIGTSNGYSTLWLASAVRAIGGAVTTVEMSDYKIGLAKATFARSGLIRYISLVHDDAGRVLHRSADGAYDLVFLDSERPEYPGWWPHLKRALRPGGLLVVDNATSHPAEMAPFVALVSADVQFVTSLVPVGNGEFLAVKADPGWSDRT
jgi:predicted O-methyltransferase YrrM